MVVFQSARLGIAPSPPTRTVTGSSTLLRQVTVAVRAEHRGRKVGTELLRQLIEYARADDIAVLSLSVEEDNPALSLYRRLGFQIVGRVDDAWTMRLDLG
jgi:GNAT superfamily N-acetyltransferase